MNQDMLAKAIEIAAQAHQGQFDKGGKPYILHPLRVMGYLNNPTEEEQCVAVLHDVIEDSGWTDTDLLSNGISPTVVNAVILLTKFEGQSYQSYVNLLLYSPIAMKVKMADLRDNMDVTRLKGITQKDKDRMNRYMDLYHLLDTTLKW